MLFSAHYTPGLHGVAIEVRNKWHMPTDRLRSSAFWCLWSTRASWYVRCRRAIRCRRGTSTWTGTEDQKSDRSTTTSPLPLNSSDSVYFIGPIPWGHSGPLCHALSSLSWTSHAACAIAIAGVWQQRHLVNGNVTAARSSEWAQHFSNASCLLLLVVCCVSTFTAILFYLQLPILIGLLSLFLRH